MAFKQMTWLRLSLAEAENTPKFILSNLRKTKNCVGAWNKEPRNVKNPCLESMNPQLEMQCEVSNLNWLQYLPDW